jgi:phasin family protein
MALHGARRIPPRALMCALFRGDRTVAQTNSDFNTFIDLQKSALAPLTRFSEASLRTFERVVRHQYAVAGDVLEYSIAQLNAITSAKDPAGLVSHQSGLAADFVAKQTGRSNEFFKLATEVQAEFGKLVESVADEAPAAAAKAA